MVASNAGYRPHAAPPCRYAIFVKLVVHHDSAGERHSQGEIMMH